MFSSLVGETFVAAAQEGGHPSPPVWPQLSQQENTSPKAKEAPRASGLTSQRLWAQTQRPWAICFWPLMQVPLKNVNGEGEKKTPPKKNTQKINPKPFLPDFLCSQKTKCHVVIWACFLLLLSPFWVLVLLSPHWLCLNPECVFLLHFKTFHYANVSNAYIFVHTEQCHHRITGWLRLDGTNYSLSARESNLMHIH